VRFKRDLSHAVARCRKVQ